MDRYPASAPVITSFFPSGGTHARSAVMNDIEAIHRIITGYPETTEETPFGPEVLVYKVAGKMFAAFNPDEFPVRINLKCDPERAVELRDEHSSIIPGYHMNKKHWNTVILDGSLSDPMVADLIDHSFQCVLRTLPAGARKRLSEIE